MIKNILYTRINIPKLIEFFILFILLVFPKINLIEVFESSYQGIRLEDFVVLFFALFLIYTRKLEIKKDDLGYNFFLFFILYIFCSILGSVYYDQKFLVILRYVQYLIILLYFNRFDLIKKLLSNVVIFNFKS